MLVGFAVRNELENQHGGVAALMTLLDVAIIAAILGFGAMLQSAVGFGMALIAVPLLVASGYSLPIAVALLLGGALVQTAHGSYVTRAHIRWRHALGCAAIQWVALAGGVACMSLLVDRNPETIKQVVGAAIVTVVTAKLIFRPIPHQRLAIGWTFVAAGSSGFIAGLVGMGGPPLVLYALAHQWDRDRFRAFLWSQFLLVLPVLAVALAIRFGLGIIAWLGVGVAMAPIVWLGSRSGLSMTTRWEPKQLQLAAVIMLYVIGLASLLEPYLR